MKRALAALVLSGCMAGYGFGQTANLNPNLPEPGTPAPALTFTKLLQAPAGTKVGWQALRGKVVVLEFWATWCAPCIGEIPVLNALASSLDPSKVQFISVDDQDPAVVEAFLKKKPISGWVGLDSTGAMFSRYKVNARPATIVIGPDGRVASSTLHPENLKREKLLLLAQGKKTDVGGKADPKVQAALEANVSKAFAEQVSNAGSRASADALFELQLTAAAAVKDGPKPDTHVMKLGDGKLEITDADIETLVTMATEVPTTRLTVVGTLPKGTYNLHVNAPNADKKKLDSAIELAVTSATGVAVEHKTADADAYALTVLPEGKREIMPAPGEGYAFYDPRSKALRCIHANVNQIASALEAVVGKPVVNETGLTGTVTADIPIATKDTAAANEALAKALGITLKPVTRPIETVVLTAPAANDAKARPEIAKIIK